MQEAFPLGHKSVPSEQGDEYAHEKSSSLKFSRNESKLKVVYHLEKPKALSVLVKGLFCFAAVETEAAMPRFRLRSLSFQVPMFFTLLDPSS